MRDPAERCVQTIIGYGDHLGLHRAIGIAVPNLPDFKKFHCAAPPQPEIIYDIQGLQCPEFRAFCGLEFSNFARSPIFLNLGLMRSIKIAGARSAHPVNVRNSINIPQIGHSPDEFIAASRRFERESPKGVNSNAC